MIIGDVLSQLVNKERIAFFLLRRSRMAGSQSGYSDGVKLNGVPTLNVIILKFTGEVVVIFSPLKIIHIFYQLFFILLLLYNGR
jgi:hypothetical protein